MAPMFRTCCGFLQIHAACKVGNPRLFLKTGLNTGPSCLLRLPAVQVRESIRDKSNYDPGLLPCRQLVSIFSLYISRGSNCNCKQRRFGIVKLCYNLNTQGLNNLNIRSIEMIIDTNQ